MNDSVSRKLVSGRWLVLAAILALAVPSIRPQGSTKPTIVQLDKTPHGITYKVNSRPTGSTPTTDILHALNQVYGERGPNALVVAIIDPRVTITEIWNFDGIAAKAQLTNIRHFVFNSETKMMSEIKWGRSIPLTTNPAID